MPMFETAIANVNQSSSREDWFPKTITVLQTVRKP